MCNSMSERMLNRNAVGKDRTQKWDRKEPGCAISQTTRDRPEHGICFVARHLQYGIQRRASRRASAALWAIAKYGITNHRAFRSDVSPRRVGKSAGYTRRSTSRFPEQRLACSGRHWPLDDRIPCAGCRRTAGISKRPPVPPRSESVSALLPTEDQKQRR